MTDNERTPLSQQVAKYFAVHTNSFTDAERAWICDRIAALEVERDEMAARLFELRMVEIPALKSELSAERTWEDDVMFRQAMGGLKELAPGLYDDIAAKIAALEAERDAERTKREEAERERDELDAQLNIAALEHQKRIEERQSVESRLAIAVEYIEHLEFDEADYEDNQWRLKGIESLEKQRREALAKINAGKEK